MGGKAQSSAKDSAASMPNGAGALSSPETSQCHPGEIIKIDVSPASLDLGKIHAGGKIQAVVTIQNPGKSLLTLQSITLNPNPGTSWSAPMPKQLALKKGESVVVALTFEAKQAGDCGGKLEVKSDATEGNNKVELKAKVFGIKDPSPEKFLAPGADNEDYKILYTVDDPAGVVDEGELQILDKDKKEIWKRALTEAERKHGKQEIAWKGQIAPATGYPDEYLTVEFSPYTSRVVLKPKGAPESVRVESVIKVEPHSLKIALGDKAHLKETLDKGVYDQVVKDGGLPADGQKRKVYLISNRFLTVYDHRLSTKQDSYLLHKKLWGGGAAVPLMATVWLRTSAAGVAESKTLAPLALGNARVLWDFADVAEDTSGLTSLPKSFVENALAYDKGATEPPGDNCAGAKFDPSLDRGGKRTDNGSHRPVLLAPSDHTDSERSAAKTLSDAYPFAASRGTTRRWAVLAEVLKTGADKGKCGILFQGSRMAGDAFTVHAYLDVNRELDRKGDLAEFIKTNQPEKHPSDKTGTLEIWKDIHIVAVFTKNGNNIHKHADVVSYYEKAYTRLVDKTAGTPTAFDEADYNTLFKAAYANAPHPTAKALGLYFNPHAIDDIDHQFTGTPAAMRALPRATFETNFLDAASTPKKVQDEIDAHYDPTTMTNLKYPQPTPAAQQAAAKTHLRTVAQTDLNNNVYNDPRALPLDRKYWGKCQEYGMYIGMYFCSSYADAKRVPDEGISIFVFAWGASGWKEGYDGLRGVALFPPTTLTANTTEARGGYIQFATHEFYKKKYPDGSHNMTRTVAHEIGHVLHLPHTRSEPGNWDDPNAHDFIDRTCVMAYNYTSVRHLCGYCLLRLRGWDHTKIASGTDAAPRQNASEPKVEITPAPADQSATAVKTSADQTFTIKNSGAGPLVVGTIVLEGANKDQYEIKAGDDKASGQTIASGASKTLKLTFTPTSAGEKTVSLRIPSNDPASPMVVTFTSKGAQPAIDATPAPLDFGDVPKDTTSDEKTLTLKNTGTPELVIEKIELIGPYAGDFVISTPASKTTLAKDATTTVKLKFKATTTQAGDAAWKKNAHLRIVSNEAASPRDVEVKGTVKLIQKMEVQNPPAAFSNVWVGKESAAHTVTLKSIGSNNLTLDGITLDGAGKAHFQLRNVPPKQQMLNGATLTFDVVYKPTAAGSHAAQIKIAGNDAKTLNLSGTAVNPPAIEMAATLACPATKAGAESAVSIPIKNKGGAELSISAVAGANAEFVLTTNVGAGIKVAAGATTTLAVKFKPGSAGAKTVSLTVTSNDPATPSATITLTGTGT